MSKGFRLSLCGIVMLCTGSVRAGADQDEPRIQGKPLSEWVKGLKSADAQVRLATVQKLAGLGLQAQPAVPALVQVLKDRSPAVRQAAAQAFRGLGPGAVPALVEALKGKDSELRRGAADAFRLMYRPPPPAQAALAEAAKGKDVYVRLSATFALHQSRPTNKAIADLCEVLAAGLKEEDVGVRRLAAGLAGSLRFLSGASGQKVNDALMTALKDRDLGVRLAAANTLVPASPFGFSRPVPLPAVLAVFKEALKDADEEVRQQGATGLARLGSRAETAVDALAAALKDRNATVRQHVAYTLAQIGPEARPAVLALAAALHDDQAVVRQLAAQALSVIGPAAKAAVPALLIALKDAEAGVRLSAVEALGNIGPAAKDTVPALLTVLDKGDNGPVPPGRFGRFGAPFAQPFASPRYLSPASARQLAAEALGRIGPDARAAVPALFKLLKDGGSLEGTAAAALRGIGKPAVPALVEGLQHGGLRLVCIETLGSIGAAPAKAVAVMMESLSAREDRLRRQSAFALGQLGEAAKPAVPALIKVLTTADNGAGLRGLAAQALGEIGPGGAAAVTSLRAALKDADPFVRHRAAYALGRIGPKAKGATAALKELLKDQDAYVRRAAAHALKQIGAGAGDIPKKYRSAIDKGLTWLAKQQHKDGHWSAEGDQYPTAMTGLAGMALLAEGSTVATGKYKDNLRRAVDWLVANSQGKSGLIGGGNQSETGRYMFGHGYGMLFLACACDGETDKARKRKLAAVLNRGAQFSDRAQTSRGGWGYVSAREGGNFDEGACTVAQVQALRAARNAGIPVPGDVLKKARKYLRDSTGADGGVIYSLVQRSGGGRPALTAAAVAVAYRPADYDHPTVKKWLQFCRRVIPLPNPGGRFGHDEYTVYYYAQAVHGLGNEGYAKLFPQSKEADRLTWDKYRDALFAVLLTKQNADGSWASTTVGPVYGTALSLTVLQLDREALPLYER